MNASETKRKQLISIFIDIKDVNIVKLRYLFRKIYFRVIFFEKWDITVSVGVYRGQMVSTYPKKNACF